MIWSLPDKMRLLLIETIARAYGPTRYAVIGTGDGREIMALVKGLRNCCGSHGISPANRLRCYHWGERVKTALATLGAWEKRLLVAHERWRQRRHMKSPSKRVPISGVLSMCETTNGRAEWEKDVEDLLQAQAPPFGIVCHLGIGRAYEIGTDIDTLMPLIDDRTLVILCGQDKGGPHKRFYEMLKRGWSGAEVGESNVAILKCPALPKEADNGDL